MYRMNFIQYFHQVVESFDMHLYVGSSAFAERRILNYENLLMVLANKLQIVLCLQTDSYF